MGRPDLAPEAGAEVDASVAARRGEAALDVEPNLPHLHGSLGADPDRNADAVAEGGGSSQRPC